MQFHVSSPPPPSPSPSVLPRHLGGNGDKDFAGKTVHWDRSRERDIPCHILKRETERRQAGEQAIPICPSKLCHTFTLTLIHTYIFTHGYTGNNHLPFTTIGKQFDFWLDRESMFFSFSFMEN